MLTIPADDARAVAVITAIQAGDVAALLRQLHDQPALATARLVDRQGVSRTLLHVVADWPGHWPDGARTVAALVAAGADVNARVIHPDPARAQETPLHWAASSDDVEVLEALLEGGADIEAPGAVFTGGSPMSDAIVFAQWHAARRLLARGAGTTIWQAAALGLVDRVQDLCSKELVPTSHDITNAFWHACRAGQQSAAAYLLEHGANLNWVGHEGKTPYDAAQAGGHDDMTQWLLERGAGTARERG